MPKELTEALTELAVQTVEKAKKADPNSEEFKVLMDSTEKLTKLVIESEKTEAEKQIETKKKSELDQKYWTDKAIEISEKVINYLFLAGIWGGIYYMEHSTGAATCSSPGKLIMGAFKPKSII